MRFTLLFVFLISGRTFAQSNSYILDRQDYLDTGSDIDEVALPAGAIVTKISKPITHDFNGRVYINQDIPGFGHVQGFVDDDAFDKNGRLVRSAYAYREMGYDYTACKTPAIEQCSQKDFRTFLNQTNLSDVKFVQQPFPTEFKAKGEDYITVLYVDDRTGKEYRGIVRKPAPKYITPPPPPATKDTEATVSAAVQNDNDCDACKMKSSKNPAVPPKIKISKESEEIPADWQQMIGADLDNRTRLNHIAPACRAFIQPDGSLGDYGKKTVKALKDAGWDCFNGDGINVDSVCPNFKDFDDSQKEYFWVWVFLSISHQESSCNPKARNIYGTNDIGCGLMQMECTPAMRKKQKRNPEFCPHTKINPYDVDFAVRCSASTMHDHLCPKGYSISVNSSQNYWQEAHGNGAITRRIRTFPLCKRGKK
jgi:hypothetical protein